MKCNCPIDVVMPGTNREKKIDNKTMTRDG